MTEVEYTEQAVEHLEELDRQVADRVMNKIDEATEWTEHRIEPLSGSRTTSSEPATGGRSSHGIGKETFSVSRRSVTDGTFTIGTFRRSSLPVGGAFSV